MSSINGGDCNIIKKYLNDPKNNVNELWCNKNKGETDKTYLTKSANRILHPGIANNQSCIDDSNKAWIKANEYCENYLNPNSQNNIHESFHPNRYNNTKIIILRIIISISILCIILSLVFQIPNLFFIGIMQLLLIGVGYVIKYLYNINKCEHINCE